uniref:SPRY domain-containing protein 7 n=1 Tax=Phallusia mammillata TaxID=59560 RepID=A0A6F9DU55_9ASCI|nr:SPRY domain-containing protein 7-like [Phallusia mammillata]
MALYWQWFKQCFGWSGASGALDPATVIEQPRIALDTSRMGTDAVIVKSGRRICGTGAGLANASILQDKAYFEVKIQSSGIWGIGLALEQTELDRVPLGEDANSWVMRHNGNVVNNKKVLHVSKSKVEEGDIVGVSYDHVELNFYINGKSINCPVSGIRGSVFPVLYVDESAILDAQFSDFTYSPPSGYSQIMVEQQIF